MNSLLKRIISNPVISNLIFQSVKPIAPTSSSLVSQIVDSRCYTTVKANVKSDGFPKLPLNAYTEFVARNLGNISKEIPNLTQTNKIKQIAAKWNTLTFEEKDKYFKKAEENRVKYRDNVQKFYESMNSEEAKEYIKKKTQERSDKMKYLRKRREKIERKRLDAPKRPTGPFFLYIKTLDRGDARVTDFVKGAAEKWKMLPEDDKKKFRDQSKIKMEEYARQKSLWDAQMLLEGKKSFISKERVKQLERATNPSAKAKKSKGKMLKSTSAPATKKIVKPTKKTTTKTATKATTAKKAIKKEKLVE